MITAAPVEPEPAQFVPPGATLILRPSAALGALSNVIWFKNGTPLSSSTPEPRIESASASDSASYRATFSGHAEYHDTSPLLVQVGVADRRRLLNLSTRVSLSPATPSATLGFVLAPRAALSFRGQPVVIRVVGPALADFGVAQPLDDPIYTSRDSLGQNRPPRPGFCRRGHRR